MDELRKRRRDKAKADSRPEVQGFLYELYSLFASGSIDPQPYSLIVLAFSDEGPTEIYFEGVVPTRAELYEAERLLRKYREECRAYPQPEDVEEMRKAQAAHEASHPYECRFEECSQRYTTERGRAIHERSCWNNPDRKRR
jgi:hypothetical protein